MVVLTIASIAVPHLVNSINTAKVARAVGDVHTIGIAIMGYDLVNQQYPATLTDVGYGANKDPWGNPYQYVNLTHGASPRTDRFAVPLNTVFDLYSMGKDGLTALPLTAAQSQDDVVWAYDGSFDGPATDY